MSFQSKEITIPLLSVAGLREKTMTEGQKLKRKRNEEDIFFKENVAFDPPLQASYLSNDPPDISTSLNLYRQEYEQFKNPGLGYPKLSPTSISGHYWNDVCDACDYLFGMSNVFSVPNMRLEINAFVNWLPYGKGYPLVDREGGLGFRTEEDRGVFMGFTEERRVKVCEEAARAIKRAREEKEGGEREDKEIRGLERERAEKEMREVFEKGDMMRVEGVEVEDKWVGVDKLDWEFEKMEEEKMEKEILKGGESIVEGTSTTEDARKWHDIRIEVNELSVIGGKR